MTEIIMDGEPLKVGDEVYCLIYGTGEVSKIKDSVFPINVQFDSGHVDSYTNDFKRTIKSLTRTLYWQKPNIAPPPKPKKNVKVYDWYVEWVIDSQHKNFVSRVNGLSEDDVRRMYPNDLIQKIDGTEREVEV